MTHLSPIVSGLAQWGLGGPSPWTSLTIANPTHFDPTQPTSTTEVALSKGQARLGVVRTPLYIFAGPGLGGQKSLEGLHYLGSYPTLKVEGFRAQGLKINILFDFSTTFYQVSSVDWAFY